MDDTAKYLIHADITADGVVERSDVVGAVFGQTEGLLGDELDIRDLQQSSKLGRIDVSIDSENGRSFGHITIASDLDRVETAILAAALETIERVGPCTSRVRVTDIQDARAAKREAVIDRAKDLLSTAFDETLTSTDIIEEVRASVRVEDIESYEDLPAGPRVVDGDAVIVVEGRADVLTLLRCGIKNAVAIEGTNVPDAVADLSHDRTTTAFLDGDRGGDLILRELAQVADIDYVARAPEGRSVEDLNREEVVTALRRKVSLDDALSAAEETETVEAAAADSAGTDAGPDDGPAPDAARNGDGGDAAEVGGDGETDDDRAGDRPGEEEAALTLADHVDAVVGSGSGAVRLLDDEWTVVAEADAGEAFEAVAEADTAPYAIVLDGTVTQRLLDLVAQRGVQRVVARERGQLTKQPSAVRVTTAEELTVSNS